MKLAILGVLLLFSMNASSAESAPCGTMESAMNFLLN